MSNNLQAAHADGPAGPRMESPRVRVNALPKWRLRRVEHYIAEHFGRCISLSELANVAGLSRMHFAAQFRTATGYRPREYLLHRRTEHAKTLLATTERPLAEIALAVGFSTQAHFSTVFKRISGESPARWRLANKGKRIAVEARRPSPESNWVAGAPYAGSNARIGGRLPVNFSTSIVVS
jgi:AraC family transcriptional regulator